ncbi:hypothetical protein SAMN04487765_0890 [Tenacibaculum sp. MAR_2010_89]|uniref:hypothetical protein n=1 Tax=Tenacibaculum sp. MAR_2010_89 TaxID=1250198 RepID=UPI0008955E26|nr:hypothetical protein [Tenacibaculum sp. MAR_2010_89]SED94875.1 hypothetical protein SAMN04487765_0890 [Tenacibaculum sp. MAR_2010_89]
MKTRMKITIVTIVGMCFGVTAQNEVSSYFQVNADNGSGYVASKIFLKSHSDYRGAGIFTLGQTNNWFIGNPYTDHANSFMIGVSNNNELNTASSQKSFAKFYLNKDGEVGIGTTTPSAKLDVRNGHLYVGDETFSNPGSWGQTINIDDNVHSRILIEERQTGVQTALWSHMGGNSKVGTISNHDFGIMTSNVARMTIKTNGNVGIGTTDTKGFKLGVNGKIATTEVKVASYANWSDFVFEKEYKLPTLTEVEKHIKEKGHLKDIPSAKEVEKNGFFLGEMDAKLLQKIEELTLYTLQQEKRLNEKDKEVKQLKEQNSKIEKLEKENIILKSLLERVTKLEKAIKK